MDKRNCVYCTNYWINSTTEECILDKLNECDMAFIFVTRIFWKGGLKAIVYEIKNTGKAKRSIILYNQNTRLKNVEQAKRDC